MPLMQSKSKKAFEKNLKTEMKHGKPQKQALAIAYATKRKNEHKRKMAEGGKVNEQAKSEHRPMPEEMDKDAHQIERNSAKHPPMHGDSMKQDDISYQAKKGMKTTPIKHPKMVPSSVVSARLRDEEDDLMKSAAPGPYGEQPPKHDDEEGPNRQGPRVPDMEDEHSTKRRPYAKGGQIEASDERHPMNKYEDDLQDLPPSEDEGSMMAHEHNEEGPDRHGDDVPDMEDQHNSGRKPYAEGGHIQFDEADHAHPEDEEQPARRREIYPDEMGDQPEEEEELMHHASIAAAIMAQREAKKMMDSGSKDMDEAEAYHHGGEVVDSGAHDMDQAARYAKGGEIMKERGGPILSHRSIYSDDSDQADLRRNAEEDANEEDQLSFNSLMKENYSESEGLDALDQPHDSNLHGDEAEHDAEDMHDADVVSRIRAKMRQRSPISR